MLMGSSNDLLKFSECVTKDTSKDEIVHTKDTSKDEIVHRVHDIIQFIESSVQCGYSALAEESPSPFVRWEYEWNLDDYEGQGIIKDDEDWDGMNHDDRDDNDYDLDLCMYWDEINDRRAR
jgi:hypothetical protein